MCFNNSALWTAALLLCFGVFPASVIALTSYCIKDLHSTGSFVEPAGAGIIILGMCPGQLGYSVFVWYKIWHLPFFIMHGTAFFCVSKWSIWATWLLNASCWFESHFSWHLTAGGCISVPNKSLASWMSLWHLWGRQWWRAGAAKCAVWELVWAGSRGALLWALACLLVWTREMMSGWCFKETHCWKAVFSLESRNYRTIYIGKDP